MTAIQVLVYRPRQNRGELVEIDDQLEAMQGLVGGYIEEVKLATLVDPAVAKLDPAVLILCNEDGREMRLSPNRLGLLGVFLVARVDGEDLCSLTPDDVERVRALLDVAADQALN